MDKQIEEDHLKLSEEQEHARKQLNQIETERNQLIKQFEEQKQKFENQLAEITTKFSQVKPPSHHAHHSLVSQVSESLSTSIETTNLEREKFEKQIVKTILRKSLLLIVQFLSFRVHWKKN